MEKYLTTDELKRLNSALPENRKGLIIQLGLELGCRVSEITHLRVKLIRERVVEIYDEKKNCYRDCVISEMTATALHRFVEKHRARRGYSHEKQLVFYECERTVNNWLKEIFAVAKIPLEKAHWHTLRHTFIRRAMPKWGIKAVEQQTGDSATTLLKYYSELTTDDRLKLIDSAPIYPIA